MHSTHLRRIRGLCPALVAAAFALATINALGAGDTIRQWQFTADGANGFKLALREVAQPKAARNQVLVRVHAVALNRRDLLMRAGRYGLSATKDGGIPLSDGAGEVIAVGADVTRFKVGDRVAGTFFEHWVDGPPSAAALASARGGNGSGMLSEVIAADPRGPRRDPRTPFV